MSPNIHSKTSPPAHYLIEAVRTIEACAAALPSPAEMQALQDDSRAAEARGYYDPIEEEKIREAYARYLGIRVAIWQVITALKPHYRMFRKTKSTLGNPDYQAFAIAFAGAEIIVKTGEHLIDLARERDIVWQKLDEAELRYGLKRKSFTRLYRQLTSFFKMRGFYAARAYFDSQRDAIMGSLSAPEFAQITEILTQLNLPSVSRGDHLARYSRFMRFSLRRRRLSSLRNVTFGIFKSMGDDIAELKIPLVKRRDAAKRVTPEILAKLAPLLRPGDVFITRHDDAMSNLFLPGFWPHGALYIGDKAARKALGVGFAQDWQASTTDDGICILEAKKDGVLLRRLEDTLHVDAFVVLRPNLAQADIAKALNRGLSHTGKLYDFIFDFGTADRLVCTEVIYRAFHGIGGHGIGGHGIGGQGIGAIDFSLSLKAGRHCLTAEDFLNQAIGKGWFTPVLICNVGTKPWAEGERAKSILRESFEAEF